MVDGAGPDTGTFTGSNRALDRRILALALPVVATLAAEPLYELTDTAILGHLGVDALGGAAIAMVALGLGHAIFVFLLYGTTAITSRLLGAGRSDDAAAQGVQALWMALALGVAAAGVLWLLGPTLLSWFGAHGAVAASAERYFSISLLGLPAFLLVMAGVGSLRGRQDTRTPLLVSLLTVMVNLVLEVTAIYALGFGVGASALSTVVAKWLGAVLLVRLVLGEARRRGQSWRPRRDRLGQLGATAWPLFVRTAMLRVAVALSAAVASRIGEHELAGYAIGFQVWITLAFLVEGLEVAGQSLVGHALGGGDRVEARRIGRRILRWSLGVGVVVGVVLWFGRGAVAGIFSDDAAVTQAAALSLAWVAATQPLNAYAFALDGILVGAGDLRFLAASMTVATACFAPLAWYFGTSGLGLDGLWAAITVFMALRAVMLGVRVRGDRWTEATVVAAV
ncbi:MAG TPA: MATE family efflux transporter [Microthrixaceae bacterium]|nr:MATE family efflux transporter [Microthrixaceae bacterium]